VSRYIEKAGLDASGLIGPSDLPRALPYNLQPRDFLRMVEDLYQLLHDLNVRLDDRDYDRLEELLDPAGFSGLISRAVVDGVSKFSRALVKNRYHNGYPDLLPARTYPGDSTPHGDRGGLEVKASRSDTSWQSHGPRAGWFCVVQFEIDRDETKAIRDREPTMVRAVMVAELARDDWSWQPAAAGRMRSGTASIKPVGRAKLRAGAVWVDPTYRGAHELRLTTERQAVFGEGAEGIVLEALRQSGRPARAAELAELVGPPAGLQAHDVKSRVTSALGRLVRAGSVRRIRPGVFEAI
jgi:hypothetical protein